MNLTKTDWPVGWNPSGDKLNGNPDGLLRMDNLQQDEMGALTLVRGIQKLNNSAFSSYVEKMVSRNVDGTETLYLALANGSAIYKAPGLSGFSLLVSGNDHAAMDDCLGQMLICAGSVKKKERSGVVKDLGVAKPSGKPTVGAVNQPSVDMTGAYNLIEGHDLSGNKWYVNADSLHGSASINTGTLDTTAMGSTGNYDLNQDTFSILVQLNDTSLFSKVRVDIIVKGTDADPTDYYSYEWTLDNPQFVYGHNTQSILTCKRGDFERQGSDPTHDWKTVKYVRVSGDATSDVWILADEAKFVGGAKGVLNGFYEYAVVNVYNNGVYLAQSPLSDPSDTQYFNNGYATISPVTDAAANEYWIFRRSVIQQIDSSLLQSHLSRWYRVGVSTGGGFDDTISDNTAIQLDITANEYLMSVQDIGDSILDIIGMDGERTLYMTFKYIYLSDRLNPDAVDTRFTLKAFGDTTEKNLWLKQVSNSLRILATTKDLYEISGTLLDLPDGSLDVNIRKIGEAFPPLGSDAANVDGGIYYIAKDGLRVTNGSNSTNISPQLAQLFANKDCHGVPPVDVTPGGVEDYAICIGRNKIFIATPHTDGTRRLIVYDTIRQRFRLQYTDPISLCATGNGKILAGYGGGSGNFVREIDSGTGVDGAGGFPITLLTVYDSNQQPRNRKDTFTLKLVLDTGGANVNVQLGVDGGSFQSLGVISCNGETTKYFDLSGHTLGFRYALKITDSSGDLTTFKLYEFTIEYEPRPEQNVYFRIPNTNLGTLARKRVISYALVVDTLGNDVTITPYIDNVAKTSGTINTGAKLTFVYFFTAETIGTDIGAILQSPSGQPFEFYTLNLEETISEKLPAPAEFLIIPANDYGSPNRKRHTSYKFQINTRGSLVRFTPKVDGTTYATLDFSTGEKRTVEYFFDTSLDVKGVDIGGTLQSVTTPKVPFEFYGVIAPQEVELLPARLESFYLPTNNFGVAARKRLRTLPLIIDTYGQDVSFTPIIDGIDGTPSTINTNGKTTAFHYFISDIFGIDFAGKLLSLAGTPFEFYGFGEPENVEVLPVAKKFDQFQPIRFDKIGKLFSFRTRLIMTGTTTSLPFTIYSDDSPTVAANSNSLYSGTLTVRPGIDNVYQFNFPQNVNGTMFRIVLGPTNDPFHRYDMLVKVAQSGMESDSKWMPLR